MAPAPTCYVWCVLRLACATCRKLVAPGATVFRCSVASCNTGRQKLRFCTYACWESHVPTARHRHAVCVEEAAPVDPAAE